MEMGTPTKKPMRAVREENRLESSALQYPIPLLIRTAKSPTTKREIYEGREQVGKQRPAVSHSTAHQDSEVTYSEEGDI